MTQTTLKALMATGTIISALAVASAGADAASTGGGAAYLGSPAMVMPQHGGFGVRQLDMNPFDAFAVRRSGQNAAPAQDSDKPSSAEVMAGFCNGAGGGASSQPGNEVHCVDPDGNDALPPVPAPAPD